MVQIKPFKALRPDTDNVAEIATLPYDVINTDEARNLGRNNPKSYLHIDRAEIDLPDSISPYDELVYQKANQNLAKFKENSWLIEETTECLYIYELTMQGRTQTGLVVCTAIEDYINERIKKHEFTRYEKEIDRINHIEHCNADTSPIFLTYRDQPSISTLIYNWKTTHSPLYDFASFHEVTHRVWKIDDEQTISTLTKEFEVNVPALYIADGHHRTESAVKVGKKRLENNPDAPANAKFRYFMSVLFPKDELSIWDYNRVLKVDIPADFLEQLQKTFLVEKINSTENKPVKSGEITMYLQNSWYKLTYAGEQTADVIKSLDVSILQTYVLEQIFHITDIRSDKRIDFVGGIRGIDELENLVDSQKFNLAFALYPTTMDQLLAVADQNQTMPPKSTWFEPKLLSGLFIYEL